MNSYSLLLIKNIRLFLINLLSGECFIIIGGSVLQKSAEWLNAWIALANKTNNPFFVADMYRYIVLMS